VVKAASEGGGVTAAPHPAVCRIVQEAQAGESGGFALFTLMLPQGRSKGRCPGGLQAGVVKAASEGGGNDDGTISGGVQLAGGFALCSLSCCHKGDRRGVAQADYRREWSKPRRKGEKATAAPHPAARGGQLPAHGGGDSIQRRATAATAAAAAARRRRALSGGRSATRKARTSWPRGVCS